LYSFPLFFTDADKIFRSSVGQVSTTDFLTYSNPILIANGTDQGWDGMCSPNITPLTKNGKTTFLLTINSWGDKKGDPNQLFYMLSTDCATWSYPPRILAPQLTKNVRAIDAAVAFANNKYYLIWKSTANWIPLIAVSDNLDSDWVLLGTPSFHRAVPEALHENFDFIFEDNQWKLLSTDNLLPFLYTLNGTGENDTDWLTWINGYELEVAQHAWNSVGKANAAAIADWRQFDGYFYLFYAGENENDTFQGRGHEKLGISRSKDLVKWFDAGEAGIF